LIAEDHAVCQLVIEEALKAAGWQVDCVQTGEQALRRALGKPYQAILMDVHLPGLRGDKVLKAIRANAGPNIATPVLAVTADVSPERQAACKRAGFDGFIEKPVRPRALIAALADVIMSADTDHMSRRAKAV
jgi:CheY-like chemotaxis protein